MKRSSSQESRSVSLSHPTLTLPNRKSTTNTLNISLDFFAPPRRGGGLNRRFMHFPYYLQLAQTLVKRKDEISLSPRRS